ncbi:glycosyltransferase family 4 protein [Hellea sp.]|nr:glycosyltransferase family 4 protein [Hellea sp.]
MARRPTVRFITRKWAPAVGGMETYCLQLTEHIKDDVDLDIHALPGNADGTAPGMFKIAGFGLKMMFKLLALPKTDVAHISDMASWPLGLMAKLRHPKTRIILSAHGSDLSFEQRSGILPKIYKAYMRLGALCLPRAVILANSQWIADLATRKGFEDVRLVPLATDMPVRTPSPAVSRHLFYAGRIIRSKGVSFIINEVLPLLPDDITLRVAGTVWEAEEGKALAHPRVKFLGQLDAEALAQEYGDALCVVVPSLAPEGFGLVAIEGALSGGVVLASNHTGLAETCDKGLGVLVVTGESAAWAEAIISTANWSASERRDFITQAQSQAQKRYSWPRVANDTLEAYRP